MEHQRLTAPKGRSLSFNARADYSAAKEWQILNKPSNVRSSSAPARRKEPISLFDLCPAAGHAERSCPPAHGPRPPRADGGKLTLALGLYNVDTEQFEFNVRSWPRRSTELHVSVIDVLFAHGFVPDPDSFHQPHPNGYGGQPTVFSFLETCLDRNADPSSRIYACVAPGMALDHMLCLLTKVPVFDFHFAVLRRCRQAAARDGFSGFELLMDELNNRELAKAAEAGSVDLSLALGPRSSVRLALPRLPTGDRAADASTWVAHWAMGALLEEMPGVFGPDLLMLLSLVLQEHRVLLVGETRHVNKIALLLHALLHPFRWHHLFLPAAVPPRNQFAAFEECPVPMIVAREVLSEQYNNFNNLPRLLIPVCVSAEGIKLKGWNFVSRIEKCLTGKGGGLFERCCGFESGPPPDAQEAEEGLGRPLCGFPEERRLRGELATAMKRWRGGQLPSEAGAEVLRVLRSGVADAARVVRGFATAVAGRRRATELDLDELVREEYHAQSFREWYGNGGHGRIRGARCRSFFCSLLDSQGCVELFCEKVQEQHSAMSRISASGTTTPSASLRVSTWTSAL